MIFKKVKKSVSERMKRVKGRGTGLESRMETILRKLRVPYQKQVKMIGRPDFKIKGTNVLLFCDSSFWHGKRPKELNGDAFRNNRTVWMKKLRANVLRDKRQNGALRKAGWSVQRFLDKDIIKSPHKVECRLLRILQGPE